MISIGDEMKHELITDFLTYADQLLQEASFQSMEAFIQHGSISCYQHSIAVAYYSFYFIQRLHIHCDEKALIQGALLHDYFLYDWHTDEAWHKWHGFRHPNFALNNALRDFQISEIEQEIIKKHMWPLTLIPPTNREAWIVNGIDTLSSFIEILGKHRPFHIVAKHWFTPYEHIQKLIDKQ